ncbi:hypothetical protein [uncultured Alistipes sp.]|jgi:hypothetical protein|uniref:hypothetical protein n=1 Tax=uncultured Alistipes sp. TaxID=538949 RepID=UPI0025DD999F|nr:hypothetical protein [uncultured Alistipes sp.]
MEDKKLNAAESLALISSMIDNTRNRMVRNSGRPFLIWGYTTVLVTAAVCLSVWYTHDYRSNYLWLALPVIGWIAMWLMRDRKAPKGKVYTFVDRVIAIVWAVMGGTVLFISLLTIFSPFWKHIPILFVVMVMMGMASAITCLIIRFRAGAIGGVACILAAPALLFTTGYWQPAIFAFGFVVMMIIPGHILNYKSNHPQQKTR